MYQPYWRPVAISGRRSIKQRRDDGNQNEIEAILSEMWLKQKRHEWQ